MKCTVKIKLNQVTCPGTLHLEDRHPVFVLVYLFGSIKKTQHVYSSFPMLFNNTLKFERIFTNAKTPDHVLEIMQDETVLIEIKQHSKEVKGGKVLAVYEENTRKFLYPTITYVTKNRYKREIFLSQTEYFSTGKALDPQLLFTTSSCIEEETLPTHHASFNNQIPSSIHSSSIHSKERPTAKKVRSTGAKKELSFHEPVQKLSGSHRRSGSSSSKKRKHCICECPVLFDEDFNLDDWIQMLYHKTNVSGIKPFRTGTDPHDLISRRDFPATPDCTNTRTKTESLCKRCVVPAKSCVLCNAYKTVYGAELFLKHRFERRHTETKSRSNLSCEISKCKSPSPRRKSLPVFSSRHFPDNTFQSKLSDYRSSSSDDEFSDLLASTPFNNKAKKSYTLSKQTLQTDANCTNETKHLQQRSKIFETEQKLGRIDFRKTGESYLDAYNAESDRIHNRIKELMRRNNSALQHDLSSSDSITDDEDAHDNLPKFNRSVPTIEPKHSSHGKVLPAPSVVVPLGGGKLWSSYHERLTEPKSPRENFNASLKSIYGKLYSETLAHNSYKS